MLLLGQIKKGKIVNFGNDIYASRLNIILANNFIKCFKLTLNKYLTTETNQNIINNILNNSKII